ncbi:hypothetical protein HK102_002506 [Quaeritorhiza haematococci]|nr:hypothetical protein HK102_002506 [Quaeritorhiza haematococci]
MVPHWKQNYKLRVVIFVENEQDVAEERVRVETLLRGLRINAEVKMVWLRNEDGSRGDSGEYDRIQKEYEALRAAGLKMEFEWENQGDEEIDIRFGMDEDVTGHEAFTNSATDPDTGGDSTATVAMTTAPTAVPEHSPGLIDSSSSFLGLPETHASPDSSPLLSASEMTLAASSSASSHQSPPTMERSRGHHGHHNRWIRGHNTTSLAESAPAGASSRFHDRVSAASGRLPYHPHIQASRSSTLTTLPGRPSTLTDLPSRSSTTTTGAGPRHLRRRSSTYVATRITKDLIQRALDDYGSSSEDELPRYPPAIDERYDEEIYQSSSAISPGGTHSNPQKSALGLIHPSASILPINSDDLKQSVVVVPSESLEGMRGVERDDSLATLTGSSSNIPIPSGALGVTAMGKPPLMPTLPLAAVGSAASSFSSAVLEGDSTGMIPLRSSVVNSNKGGERKSGATSVVGSGVFSVADRPPRAPQPVKQPLLRVDTSSTIASSEDYEYDYATPQPARPPIHHQHHQQQTRYTQSPSSMPLSVPPMQAGGPQPPPSFGSSTTSPRHQQQEEEEEELPSLFNVLSPKTQHVILNQLMRKHSSRASTAVLFTTLPAPDPGTGYSRERSLRYLEQLDVLTRDLPPSVLVHGKGLTVTMSL